MVLNSLSSSDLPAVSGVASAFRGHAGRRLTVRGKTAAAPGLAGGERRSMAEQLELLTSDSLPIAQQLDSVLGGGRYTQSGAPPPADAGSADDA